MALKSICSKIFRAFARFRLAERGNVAITFAFATLPIIGFVGTSVDYSHANAVKVAMQAALDSTALMLAKDASTLSHDELRSDARKYFLALFTRPEATDITINASYTTDGGSAVNVDGSAEVPTKFLGIIGYDTLTVDGTSVTKWGSSRLRVALVLDVTGSMASDGKMSALKTATKNLLTTLKGAASNNGDVYVSIIPFNKDVNVGDAYYNANWIDWSDWEDDNGSWHTTSNCSNSGGHSRRGRSRCTSTQEWVLLNHNRWNGCVTDRDQDYDQKATAPRASDADLPGNQASTLFPAEQFSDCPVAMMGLSYNWSRMGDLVDSMQPVGNTNQPIGLVWGWQSLVGGGPLTAPAMDSNYKYQQIIILLSDGMNTENRWSTSQSQVDNRMHDSRGNGTCANIKASGITIYTLQVNTGRDPTSTLLKACASDGDKFFLLSRASDISSAFTAIGTNLTKLRVAQ
ncbi:MAG TPA: pilus assembly protein [Pseudolabrys sp.]|nr:pilus assembly protein [Pseudolabrys sp.]